MGKRKAQKKSPSSISKGKKTKSRSSLRSASRFDIPMASVPFTKPCSSTSPVEVSGLAPQSPVSSKVVDNQLIVPSIILDAESDLAVVTPIADAPEDDAAAVKVVHTTEPAAIIDEALTSAADPVKVSLSSPVIAASIVNTETSKSGPKVGSDSWVNLVKGSSKPLKKQGTSFTLDSGEACINIPNSIIERNKKSWDCFVLGQFYTDPPAQGTIHNIVNGIWSKNYRDIVVSKMAGNAFLFRIPNAFTRSRVLNQRLWQIDGLTMFVAKWDPGVVPAKPELKSAPIWLELRNVPLQVFHEEGLERIAGLVGDPKFLHPTTANKTNLEVAKVFTLIDPRKPLPKAVNVQFDYGAVQRILVSSLWMPPVCGQCKEIGHNLRHCKEAPITCTECHSSTHSSLQCPKLIINGPKKKRNSHRRRSRSLSKPSASCQETAMGIDSDALASAKGKDIFGKIWAVKKIGNSLPSSLKDSVSGSLLVQSTGLNLGLGELQIGEPSNALLGSSISVSANTFGSMDSGQRSDSDSVVEEDSSDVMSSDQEEEVFIKVLSKRQRKSIRGTSLKTIA